MTILEKISLIQFNKILINNNNDKEIFKEYITFVKKLRFIFFYIFEVITINDAK